MSVTAAALNVSRYTTTIFNTNTKKQTLSLYENNIESQLIFWGHKSDLDFKEYAWTWVSENKLNILNN